MDKPVVVGKRSAENTRAIEEIKFESIWSMTLFYHIVAKHKGPESFMSGQERAGK
jgi:hypothetical protein